MKIQDIAGRYTEVSQRFIKPGDVVRLPQGDHVVLRKQSHSSDKYRVTAESVETGRQCQFYVGKTEKVWRFKIQGGLARSWNMALGDVVRYPRECMVAIRYRGGWYASAGRRGLLPDVRVLHDVISGRAEVVRNAEHRDAVRMRRPYLPGSVAATSDLTCPDPTAWICVGRDHWCSTTWVEASDLMIQMELVRNRYDLLYVPTPERKP